MTFKGTCNLREWGVLLALLVSGCTTDTVRLENFNSPNAAIVFVSGEKNGVRDTLIPFRTTSGVVAVGDIDRSIAHNEVAVMQRGRALTFVPDVPWTAGEDEIIVPQREMIRFPARVWILHGSFAKQRRRALKALTYLDNQFAAERVGIRTGDVVITDARFDDSGNRVAENWESFDDLRAVHYDPVRVNFYYVHSYQGSKTKGVQDGFDPLSIAIAKRLPYFAVPHEVAHAAAQMHVDDQPGFTDVSDRNFMHPTYRRCRELRYFSEGQIFRMHLAGLVRDFGGAADTRNCLSFSGSSLCLPIQKRFFPDGNNFPPN